LRVRALVSGSSLISPVWVALSAVDDQRSSTVVCAKLVEGKVSVIRIRTIP